MSYHGLQPFGFLLLLTLSNTSFPTRCLLSLLTCLINKCFSTWRQVVRETIGSRKASGLEDLSPFTPFPGRPDCAWRHQLNRGCRGWDGGWRVSALCRENLLFPHPQRMTGPYCFHSFTPPLPWLLSVLVQGRIWWKIFFVWHFLLLLLKWFILFIKHQGNTISLQQL